MVVVAFIDKRNGRYRLKGRGNQNENHGQVSQSKHSLPSTLYSFPLSRLDTATEYNNLLPFLASHLTAPQTVTESETEDRT